MNINKFSPVETVLVSGLFLIVFFSCNDKSSLFTKVAPDNSRVHFSNRITENDSLNILDYEYIYNGGGIGIGDFNNDGYQDFFASGNMVSNALYLNKGGFQFEDITDVSGVTSSGQWSSGVAIVDINADGKDDIYVCNTTHKNPQLRRNNLYINQGTDENGIPKFVDMAGEYGLADDSYSVNAAFFDYDNDDDLDVIIIINEMGDTKYHSQYRAAAQRKFFQRVDKLYRNDQGTNGHPVFVDVSAEAKIDKPGFSLGVNIGDFNKDGWKDIYISNDFLSDDLVYINQKDGTFREMARALLKHTSHSAMGVDVSDLNNDGLDDIIVLDMLPEDNQRQKRLLGPTNYTSYINNERFGYSYQYVRNTFQLNNGLDSIFQPQFSDISLQAGIAATDWSWAPIIADFDFDGNKDLIITNGFPKDVTDRDYLEYKSDSYRFASKEMMLSQIPAAKVANYAYRNNGDLTFNDVSKSWGLDFKSYSNGAAYGDLDNDGDLDLVINNINDSISILKNNLITGDNDNNYIIIDLKGKQPNAQAIGARIKVSLSDRNIWYEHAVYRGYLSSHGKKIHIGIGSDKSIDGIEVIWPDGIVSVVNNPAINEETIISYADSQKVSPVKLGSSVTVGLMEIDTGFEYVHIEDDFIDFNIQPLLPHKLSQYGPSISTADINGDGMDDLYIGGAAFFDGYMLIAKEAGGFDIDTLFSHDKRAEEMGCLFFDADADGDNDLFIATGSYEFSDGDTILRDRFYENRNGEFVYNKNALPDYLSNAISAKGADYDRDGDIDLFIGVRSSQGSFPEPVSSLLLRNESVEGMLQFTTSEDIPELEKIGMVSDAIWSDIDNNGWIDLILVGEFMEITAFVNGPAGFTKTIFPSLKNLKGIWNSITGSDIDKDGDIDYIIGNLGTNTFIDINEDRPYRLYVNDFDKNGSNDAIPFGFLKDENGTYREYPLSAKMDLVQELNQIRKMYPTYQQYSYVDRKKMITKATMKETAIYELNYPFSVVLINTGEDLIPRVLPSAAQMAPLFGMVVLDLDQDGHQDILAVGNDYGNELIYGRMDALNGLALKGDGQGQFIPLPLSQSGFYVPGDGKSLSLWKGDSGLSVVTGMNKGPLSKFDIKGAFNVIEIQPDDVRAVMTGAQGSWIEEFYYGHSFVSQQSRILIVPPGVDQIEIIKFTGSKRVISELN